ncbi:MAG: VOC family protein [Candidatus Velthaea sp.]|jgi:PhnB protein
MTSTANAPTALAHLRPYIFFYGRCQEALDFYADVLGGTSEVMLIKDTPVAEHFPTDFRDKVMHASFTAPGISFFASDGREAKGVDPDAGNISIALSFTDSALGQRVLDGLSDGGKVTMPLGDAFWGGRFASLVDRFGVEWLMTLP